MYVDSVKVSPSVAEVRCLLYDVSAVRAAALTSPRPPQLQSMPLSESPNELGKEYLCAGTRARARSVRNKDQGSNTRARARWQHCNLLELCMEYVDKRA